MISLLFPFSAVLVYSGVAPSLFWLDGLVLLIFMVTLACYIGDVLFSFFGGD